MSSNWANIIEKAYAQYVELGTSGHSNINSYASISSGWDEPLVQLTGRSITEYSYSSSDFINNKTKVISALANHQEVWLGSWKTTTDSINGRTDFVEQHAFAVTGYNTKTDKFVVTNPWGTIDGSAYNGYGGTNWQFEASMTDIKAVQGVIAVLDSKPSSSVNTEQSLTRIQSAPMDHNTVLAMMSQNLVYDPGIGNSVVADLNLSDNTKRNQGTLVASGGGSMFG